MERYKEKQNNKKSFICAFVLNLYYCKVGTVSSKHLTTFYVIKANE